MAERESVEAYLERKTPAQSSSSAACVIVAFPHTKLVTTHRRRIADAAELDDALAALVAEAYEEVGPGTRGLAPRLH